jgi:hypothetical protein
MEGQLERLRGQVWRHLEAGEWREALAAAEQLAQLDAPAADSAALAESARVLTRIAEALRHGQPLKHDALARLEKIAMAWPQLAQERSFQSLVQAAKKGAKVTPPEELSTKRPPSQGRARPLRRESRPSLLKRIARPKGWAGIAATVALAALILLFGNDCAIAYLKVQPRSTHGPEVWGVRYALPEWQGLVELSAPVDTLILGDSEAQQNLLSGPIADRLGGSIFNLGNILGTTLLSDAWMLQYYIDKFGAPRNVILLRDCMAYESGHSLELMSIVPLKWGYWDRLGPAPLWESGEERRLYISKNFPLYSESDILSYRLEHPDQLFSQPAVTAKPYRNYSFGTIAPSDFDDILSTRPWGLYGPSFSPSADSENALRAMSDQARRLGFQLYIPAQPEWDKLYEDPDRQARVNAKREWLAQFADPEYVHLVSSEPMVFQEEQMQSPTHLRLGAARQYTEAVLSDIVATQNRMAATQAKSIRVTSAVLDKSSYTPGEKPAVTLLLTTDECADPMATASGTVSGLVRLSGKSDGEWVARAQATAFTAECGKNTEVMVTFSVGEIDEAGAYDLVLFLRQNAGVISFETRVDLPSVIEVS